MHDAVSNFINLDTVMILYLFCVGFVGGLVSGFIGSGGAFVLTPGMMSLGVPGVVAVASNMCHKFPKALVGAIERFKYGQVGVKLGIVLGVSAEAGVLYGAQIQENIKKAFGDAGSNLYVSVAFVVILATVGGFVLYDAWKTYKSGNANSDEKAGKLATWVQSINIPGTMVYLKSINARVSILFTIPLGFATGLMASATELVIAFVMGLGGSLKYALHGMVDIRLAMIILAGSLFGIQLGAIGTTYVKPFMIKVVMGVIMVIVLFSRGLMVPVYLSQLGLIRTLTDGTVKWLRTTSFAIMIISLLLGAFIVLRAMWHGRRAERLQHAASVLE